MIQWGFFFRMYKMLCNWFFVVVDFLNMWVSFCEIRNCCVTDDLRYLIYQWGFYVTVRYLRTSRLSWSTPSRPSTDRMSEETPQIDWSPTPGTPCRERSAHAQKTQHKHCVYLSTKHSIHFIRLSQKSAQNKIFFFSRQYLKHSIQLKYTI